MKKLMFRKKGLVSWEKLITLLWLILLAATLIFALYGLLKFFGIIK